LIIIFVAFTVLYTLAPNVKIKMKSVIPGAIFATIIFLSGSFLFSIYISNFANYSKTYGSIAGIIILMLWLYITGFIIIIGAEINAIIHQRKVVAGKTPEEQTMAEIEDNQHNISNESDSTSSKEFVTDDHETEPNRKNN